VTKKVINLSDLDGHNGFEIFGPNAYKGSDYSVSSAGDFNGDGIDDLLVGNTDANASYVVFGSAGWSEQSLDLTGLDGSNGFKVVGEDSSDLIGFSVAAAGDFNKDGIDDLLIGAPEADGNHFSQAAAGRSYIVFGTPHHTSSELAVAQLNGLNGVKLISAYKFGDFGTSVSYAGDVNGDGFDDVVIGAPNADANGYDSGLTTLVFGSGDWSDINPAVISSSYKSFKLNISGSSSYSGSGYSVSHAGDFNSDGYDDFLIGEPTTGKSYVIFGANQVADIGFGDRFELSGADRLGYSVSDAGDFNGDGIHDVIIGSRLRGAGECYVVFGSPDRLNQQLTVSDLDGSNGFKIIGVDSGDQVGSTVTSLGDVNGDGIDDLAIGAYGAGADWGETYVLYGSNTWSAASFELAGLDETTGFQINGYDPSTESGAFLSSAGDVNGDGINDILIGTGKDGVNGTSSPDAYVVFGIKNQTPLIENAISLVGPRGLIKQDYNVHIYQENAGRLTKSSSDFGPTYTQILSAELEETTDGAVDISDVISQLRHIVGLSELTGLNKAAADNDANGSIDISDVISSLRQIVGLQEAPNARIVDAQGNHEFMFDDSVTELYVVAAGDADLSWTPLELV